MQQKLIIKHLSDPKPPHCLLLQTSLHEFHSSPRDVDLVGIIYLLVDYLDHIVDGPNLKWRLTEE
jgi:hypothetical protein